MATLKKKYISYIKTKKKIIYKKYNFRIATYNVHYWTDVFEKNTMKHILNDIKYIDADILFIQEAVFGVKYKVQNNLISSESIISKLEELGYFTIICNVLPTWFGGFYGNIFCVKKKYMKYVIDKNYTFPKSKKNCIISGNKESTKETRCYIQLELFDYVIIGIHLDVCSEIERISQIRFILKSIDNLKNKKIIILGDFNTTDINQYSDINIRNDILKFVFNNNTDTNNNVINLLSKKGFKGITKNIKMTTWSNIQTDYIFYKNIPIVYQQILYTINSDHLPICMDIKDDVFVKKIE